MGLKDLFKRVMVGAPQGEAVSRASGEPVYISIAGKGSLPTKPAAEEKGKKKFFSFLKKGSKNSKGIYYNVPARVGVSIFDVNRTICETECSLAQLGYVEMLDVALFNKKPSTKVTFYQENGGVKRLEQ